MKKQNQKPLLTMRKLLTIEIRCGEYEFTSHSIHDPDADLQDYLKHFYGGRATKEDGSWYFNGGEVCVSEGDVQDITEAETQVLKRLGVAA